MQSYHGEWVGKKNFIPVMKETKIYITNKNQISRWLAFRHTYFLLSQAI
jgi:hypothetical protein